MQQNRPANPGPRGQGTILVVDDSPTIRKLVSMTLESKGYRVILACDGVDGLAKMQEGMPDLILSDITMPRLDGYQFCKVVKSNKETKHIPVIMLSGNDGLFDKVRGKMVGSANYITKPFEPNNLVKEIEKFVKTGGGAVRPAAPAAPKQPAAARPAPSPSKDTGTRVDLAASERLRKNLSGLYIPSQGSSADLSTGEAKVSIGAAGPSAKAPAPSQPRPAGARRPMPKRDDEPEIKIFYNNEPAEEPPAQQAAPPPQPAAAPPAAAPQEQGIKEFDVGGGLSFKVVTPQQGQTITKPSAPTAPPPPRPEISGRQAPAAQQAPPAARQAPAGTPARPSQPAPQAGGLNIKVKCSGCGTVYGNIKPQHIGKYANCKKCGTRFLIG